MPKYLIQASYTAEGTTGLLKDGGSKRHNQIKKTMKDLGGKVDVLYYALGDADIYVIIDAPDNITLAALSMAVTASGGIHNLKTTPLLTPKEIDEAAKKTVSYRPPGQ